MQAAPPWSPRHLEAKFLLQRALDGGNNCKLAQGFLLLARVWWAKGTSRVNLNGHYVFSTMEGQ